MALTQEQASTIADNQNTTLTGGGVSDFEYKIFESFDSQFASFWQLTLVPTKYDAQYDAATLQQTNAFARVSLQTQLASGVTTANFVTNFDTNAAADPVLSAYLGL